MRDGTAGKTGLLALAESRHQVGRFGAILGMAVAVMAWSVNGAHAVPFTSDLIMSGEIAFDQGSTFIGGNGTQNAFMRATQGGATSVGEIEDFTQVSGPNPIAATLTDFNDGFSFQANSQGVYDPQQESAEFALGFNFDLGIVNSSASNTYKITFEINLDSSSVLGSGLDAFAASVLTLDLDLGAGPNQAFSSQIVSAPLSGDEKNGNPLGTFGAEVSDSDLQLLDVTLAPGEAASFEAAWFLLGGAFDFDSFAEAGMNFLFSVNDVMNLTPQPVPEPGSLVLLGVGLLALGSLSWRRRGPRKAVIGVPSV